MNGRRIGKEAMEAVRQAAEQTLDKRLRFYARHHSGLLENDLRLLSFDEQAAMWKLAVKKSKGILEADEQSSIVMTYLTSILVENAPETIPWLTRILQEDGDAYIREEALHTLELIDWFRVRLRTSEVGRHAIAAIQRALQRAKLKPVFSNPEAGSRKWKDLGAQMLNDEVPLNDNSRWSLVALAFDKFYGTTVTKRYLNFGIPLIEAIPEFRKFVTYLTEKDPYFPSWEYTYVSYMGSDEALHPGFRSKIARYYEQWKNFKKELSKSNIPSGGP
jgi:hypothetical protein